MSCGRCGLFFTDPEYGIPSKDAEELASIWRSMPIVKAAFLDWGWAEEAGWIEFQGEHYCQNCWEWDEETARKRPKADLLVLLDQGLASP